MRTWLRRIVVNACIDRIRTSGYAGPSRGRSASRPAGPDPAVELATRMAVGEALAMVPVEQRIAVVLVDVQGYPVAEAAAILEVPAGTVKSRCARGRARLAACSGT